MTNGHTYWKAYWIWETKTRAVSTGRRFVITKNPNGMSQMKDLKTGKVHKDVKVSALQEKVEKILQREVEA